MENLMRSIMDSNMPASILHRFDGIANLPIGMKGNYETVTARYLSTATKLWLKGELTNFDYLMNLNIAAGRSFQDLTSYPVFPWIIGYYTLNKYVCMCMNV